MENLANRVKKYQTKANAELNPFEIGHHPVANIMPMMSDEEFEELKQDIMLKGQLEPITVVPVINPNSEYKYLVVDGRNRVETCKELEISVIANIYKSIIPNALLKEYVKSIHKRRNLTADQKAYMAFKEYMKLKEKGEKIKQMDIAAKHGVSNKNVSYISKIFKTFGMKPVEEIYLNRKTQILGRFYFNYKSLYDEIRKQENKTTDIEQEIKNMEEYKKIELALGKDTAIKGIKKIIDLKSKIEDKINNELDEYFKPIFYKLNIKDMQKILKNKYN